MDERVEEVRPISPVSPVRKLILARPRKERRELTYQFNQYRKAKKTLKTNIVTPKMLDVSDSLVPTSKDYVADLKKRSAFDRAMIIGD